jgi:hypothetical protein
VIAPLHPLTQQRQLAQGGGVAEIPLDRCKALVLRDLARIWVDETCLGQGLAAQIANEAVLYKVRILMGFTGPGNAEQSSVTRRAKRERRGRAGTSSAPIYLAG